jgi:hypothetical protein
MKVRTRAPLAASCTLQQGGKINFAYRSFERMRQTKRCVPEK